MRGGPAEKDKQEERGQVHEMTLHDAELACSKRTGAHLGHGRNVNSS
jgi:hypothetical protein